MSKNARHFSMRRLFCVSFLFLMIASNVPIPVFARISDENLDYFSKNNIMFYNPDANCNYDGGECHTPTGSEITWIGDSYSVGALNIIKEKFSGVDLGTENPGNSYSPYSYIQISKHLDWISNTSLTDANGGPSGVDILKTIKQDELRPVLVLALGTNDVVGADTMNTTLNSIADYVGNDTTVILTTAYIRGGGAYKDDNEAKIKFANEHSNFYVADWASVADDKYYTSDSDHPTDNDGYKAWVDTIEKAIPQTCSNTSTNEIIEINGNKYTFPLLGATKDNYLNPGKKKEIYSELSPLPCQSKEEGTCHHNYYAVDLGLYRPAVDGQEITEDDFPDIKGQYKPYHYYSTGVKVLAFVSGTITSYKYYHNDVPNNYDSKCASVMFQGDDGQKYWIGHMSYDSTVHEGTHFNVGDVIGEVGPPPCAQGTQAHLHIDTEDVHTYYIVDLMNKLYDKLPDSAPPNPSYASYKPSSSTGQSQTLNINTGNLPAETIKYLDDSQVKELAEKNMERYLYAEQETGIPWQAIAAIHFREGGMRPEASISNGEPLTDHINVDGIQIVSDPNVDTANQVRHFIDNAKNVYGVELSASSSIEDWGNAFLAYNRGYMYKDAGKTWDQSPYVMNGYDEDHLHMKWIHADSWYKGTHYNSVEGTTDANPGALAIMKYLGGDLFGSSICRNPNQHVTGGLTNEQAKALIQYYQSEKVDANKFGLPYGKWNCVSLSAWFIQQFTSIGITSRQWGNGREVVENLKNDKHIKEDLGLVIETGNEPRPFAVFSVTQGITVCDDGLKCGHTGIVVAVDGDNVTFLEAAYNNTGYAAVVTYPRSYFVNEKFGEAFAYLDSILDQKELNRVLAEMGV